MRNFFTFQDDMIKSYNDNDDDDDDISLTIMAGVIVFTSPIGWIIIGYLFIKQFFNK